MGFVGVLVFFSFFSPPLSHSLSLWVSVGVLFVVVVCFGEVLGFAWFGFFNLSNEN